MSFSIFWPEYLPLEGDGLLFGLIDDSSKNIFVIERVNSSLDIQELQRKFLLLKKKGDNFRIIDLNTTTSGNILLKLDTENKLCHVYVEGRRRESCIIYYDMNKQMGFEKCLTSGSLRRGLQFAYQIKYLQEDPKIDALPLISYLTDDSGITKRRRKEFHSAFISNLQDRIASLLDGDKKGSLTIDLILGFAMAILLYSHSNSISTTIEDSWHFVNIQFLALTIDWLMGWPAGLKLNYKLDHFLGQLFLWLLRVWLSISETILPSFALIVNVITLSCLLGITSGISLLIDLLRIYTLHIHFFYRISARLYRWEYSVLVSLFYLFRGKKWNTLRTRLDSADYELDQLLLGTVLLSLLVFVYPTVAVYYVLFLMSFLGKQIILTLMLIAITLLMEIKYYQLLKSIWSPMGNIKGIYIKTDDSGVLRLHLQPYTPLEVILPDIIKSITLNTDWLNFSNLKNIIRGFTISLE